MSGLAPKLPLRITEIDGAYGLIKDFTDLIEQNFKMLLLTSPGERIMNPDYGIGLKQYLFENKIMQEATQSRVKARIFSQVKQYMPHIEIDLVDFITKRDEPNGINVFISYTIVPLNIRRELDLSMNIDRIF